MIRGLREKAKLARRLADDFLDILDEGHIEGVYLIGSRATGRARTDSDWDFLIVGEDFDLVEEERCDREYRTYIKPGEVDIIFSSTPPKNNFVVCDEH